MTDTEKAALEKRIDELCQENERLRALADGAANEADRLTHDAAALQIENAKLRKQLEYNRQTSRSRLERIDQLKDENAKLRELVARMAEALGIDCEWADPNWCKSPCVLAFECWPESDHTELRCPAWAIMHELGIEVPS